MQAAAVHAITAVILQTKEFPAEEDDGVGTFQIDEKKNIYRVFLSVCERECVCVCWSA